MKFRNKRTGEIRIVHRHLINSALVSAQNRNRYYWCNWETEQPEDRGILLKDILETGVVDKDKAYCLKHQAGNTRDYFKKHHTQIACEPVAIKNTNVEHLLRPYGSSAKIVSPQAMRVYSTEGKSVNITAGGGGMGGKTGLYAIPVNTTSDGKSHTIKAQYYKNGIANFITNNGFDATSVAELVADSQTVQNAIPCEWDENSKPTKAISCADGKTYTVYEIKDGQIIIRGKQYPIKLSDGFYIIRKLTVRECARLQTMPDDYCEAVSDSQAYKALGNGWTAEVIIHLLNHALKDVPRDEEIVVLSMYDGIATGRYCLDKMGFTNVTYHAYEIDKYPIMVAMDNYPDIIQHGDAFAVREDDWKPPQTRAEWLDELFRV